MSKLILRSTIAVVALCAISASDAFAADARTPTPSQPVDVAPAAAALGALNAACTVTLQGTQSAGFQLAAGTLVGTIVPEVSYDGGTTYNATFFDDPTTGNKAASVVFGSSNTATAKTLVGAGGASHARVRVSVYTSGTANCSIRGSAVNDPSVLSAGATGSAVPPVSLQVGGSDGANLRSFKTDSSGNLGVGTGTAGTAASAVVTVQGVSSGTSGASALAVQGQVGNNVAAAGNPHVGGAVAVAKGSAPATVTAGNAGYAISDTERRLLVNAVHPNFTSANASAVTATTQILGLSGAGLSYYITDILFFNNVATAQTVNIISSTTAGNACATSPATVTPNVVFGAVANGQWAMSLQTPIKVAANSALCCKLSAATSASCMISGFIGP